MRMKLSFLFLSSITLVFSFQSIAQFEGAIDMKVSAIQEDSTYEMVYTMLVKKDMLAADVKGAGVEAQQGHFIFRGDKHLMWLVNDDDTSFVEIALSDSEMQRPSNDSSLSHDPSNIQLVKTGKSERILGYQCDEYLAAGQNHETHIWGTKKLGNVYEGLMKSFGEMGGKQLKAGDDWETQLADMKLFPLKIVTIRENEIVETQEVTKIVPRKIAAAVFLPPKGYRKQSMEFNFHKLMQELQKQGSADNPGNNPEMEKLLKELQEQSTPDTSGK